MDRSTQFVLTAFGTVGEPVVLRRPLQRGCCRLSLLPEFDRQCQGALTGDRLLLMVARSLCRSRRHTTKSRIVDHLAID